MVSVCQVRQVEIFENGQILTRGESRIDNFLFMAMARP
jgi:hypothetical protein